MNRANTDLVCCACGYRFDEEAGDIDPYLTIWGNDTDGPDEAKEGTCPACNVPLVIEELVVRTFRVHTMGDVMVAERIGQGRLHGDGS